MKRIFLCVLFGIFLCAYVLSSDGTVISVNNPTRYNVYFERVQKINKNSNGTVTLYIERGTLSGGFDILYEIPLSGTVPLYVRGDHRTIRENQTSLTINEPRITENYGRYITIHNNADNAITFRTGGTVNPLMEQRETYLVPSNKREFSPGETGVFNITNDSGHENFYVHDSGRDVPLTLPLPLKRNYLYAYTYAKSGVTLTDVRPLHRAGEPGWVETIRDANAPLQLTTSDGEIHVFAPCQNGLVRHVFDSAGNSKAKINSGESFTAAFTAHTDGGFFVAGYQADFSIGMNISVARIHGEDGIVRRFLAPSTRPEYYSALFNTAAAKDGAWLLAGAADSGTAPAGEFSAYLCMARDSGSALSAVWELGGTEFDAALNITSFTPLTEPRCGEIRAAVYDTERKKWLLTGKNLEWNLNGPVTGSFIAVVSDDGSIQKIDTSFKGMSFYKILLDSDGNYYLAGEEQKGNETVAVVVKYDAEGRRLWHLSSPPASNSFYQDALFDIDNGQIVLGGTLRAADGTGSGGTPFIEGLDIKNGTTLWREELTDSRLAGISLVTAIARAPDYGFALTLCGITEGYISQPYIAARVNSRGRLIR